MNLLLFPALVLFSISCESRQPGPTDLVLITYINDYAEEKTAKNMKFVQLPHVKHEKAGMKCIACHHKTYNDDRIKVCAQCHIGEDGENLMHNFCIGCHEKRVKDSKKAPVDCEQCHNYGTNGD